MANIHMKAVLADLERDAAADARTPRTKLVCTLGPASRSVPMLEKLLRGSRSGDPAAAPGGGGPHGASRARAATGTPARWVVVEAAPDVDNFLTAAEAAAGKERHHRRNAALKYIEISLAL
ncbi:hypothetical protein QYE76_046672 [Lolium multiflorum]|uniref:Pyruvate kinase n=1 Tax=Lolium multiflorum TaxID=4521 RepID=A0AAD8TMG9_LOLMU|nr:hypothetical protein QYE76_046672 [Lolium multiflorum]